MAPSTPSIKDRLTEDMKAALRAGDKAKLGAVRLILAAVKQREIDDRTTLDDSQVLSVLEKMVKQRRDSIAQYERARREDLIQQEQLELDVIQAYMPAPLSEAELEAIIDEALAATGAASVKDMGKVMGMIKPRVQGRADMGAVGARIKARLTD